MLVFINVFLSDAFVEIQALQTRYYESSAHVLFLLSCNATIESSVFSLPNFLWTLTYPIGEVILSDA